MASSALFAPGLIEGIRAAGRIYEVVDYKPPINSATSEGLTTPMQGRIQFDKVTFKYAGRDNIVLNGVTFEIPAGKHHAITGASGSGKTTLTQLILRFYDPLEGTVYIDGVDIRMYNIKH